MPRDSDFRIGSNFSVAAVNSSGLFIGKRVYWKLYAIENIYRVLIHSILTIQINSNWWSIAVDQNIRQKAQKFRQDYLKRPWHTNPGVHDIYYIHLSDLNKIALVNSHLLVSLIPDIDQWIVKIETLRLPRNVVVHMNFPNPTDRARIGVLYDDFKNLLSSSIASRITLKIP